MSPTSLFPQRQRSYTILFLGLGLITLGLATTFIGLGDKGYRTAEFRMVGPATVTLGIVLVLVKVFICMFDCSSVDLEYDLLPQERQQNLMKRKDRKNAR